MMILLDAKAVTQEFLMHVKHGNHEIAQAYLSEKRSSIDDSPNAEGNHALHLAVNNLDKRMLDLLLDYQFLPSLVLKNKENKTVFDIALEKKRWDIAIKLINKCNIHFNEKHAATAALMQLLCQAVKEKLPRFIQDTFASNFDLAWLQDSESPFHVAIERQDKEMLSLLLKVCGDKGLGLTQKNAAGDTPIVLAAKTGFFMAVINIAQKFPERYSLDITPYFKRTSFENFNKFDYYQTRGYDKLIRDNNNLLLPNWYSLNDLKAFLRRDLANNFHECEHYYEVQSWIISNEFRDDYGAIKNKIALHATPYFEYEKALLECFAYDEKNCNDRHDAIHALIKALGIKRTNPYKHNVNNNSILHLAALQNDPELVLLLQRNGENPNEKNSCGKTAHDLANEMNFPLVTQVFSIPDYVKKVKRNVWYSLVIVITAYHANNNNFSSLSLALINTIFDHAYNDYPLSFYNWQKAVDSCHTRNMAREETKRLEKLKKLEELKVLEEKASRLLEEFQKKSENLDTLLKAKLKKFESENTAPVIEKKPTVLPLDLVVVPLPQQTRPSHARFFTHIPPLRELLQKIRSLSQSHRN